MDQNIISNEKEIVTRKRFEHIANCFIYFIIFIKCNLVFQMKYEFLFDRLKAL